MGFSGIQPAVFGIAFATVGLALAAPASAQIYAWRDGGGNLVLSDTPKDPAAKTYDVRAAQSFRTTRPVTTIRATGYDDLIEEHANRQALSTDLVRAVIQQESAFNPRARSVKGAMGLMQLMPSTAARYGVMNAFDPSDNIRAGVAYLRSLLDRYNDDETLALAAYNAGPHAVEKYGRTVPPYRETRNYVMRITNRAGGASRPAAGTRVFKTLQIIDGQPVPRYTNRPTDGAERIKTADRR
jgi:soluble lytic murein transglycosylase-like protein